jgi:hypothetical protein
LKKTLNIDMDNVLVDFPSGMAACDPALLEQFKDCPDEIPGIFALLSPPTSAKEPNVIESSSANFLTTEECQIYLAFVSA